MKKSLIRLLSLIALVILACGVFSGCFFFQFVEDDINEGFDDPDAYEEPDYVFTVACTADKTVVTLSGVGYYGDTASVVYLRPYEYLYGEEQTGIVEGANAQADSTFVAEYECGSEATFTVDRYNGSGYDTVYCKFYVVQGSNVIAGPIYPTTIQPTYTHDEVVKVNGIKGVMFDFPYYDEIADLGCEHTQLNFVASDMIVPLETYDEATKTVTPITYEESFDSEGNLYIQGPKGDKQCVESYVYNGTKYYFRAKPWQCDGRNYTHVLSHYDNLVPLFTRQNIKVSFIMLLWLDLNQYGEPYFLTYPAARTNKNSTYSAVNTSNPYGAGYWGALMEFISDRYSREDSAREAKYGTVESYIIGNEIDQFSKWNNIVDLNVYASLPLETYCTEYERTLRIANQAVKKAYSRNIVLVPFTHFWTSTGNLLGNDYKPKELFDFMSLKTKIEGNYNWGLAIHPYGADLQVVDFWRNDVDPSNPKGVTGSLNTGRITWTNLEVLQLYLEQPIKLCDGKVRDVFVTEGGVTASDKRTGLQTDQAKTQQAAGVAYAYYKSTQLSCIKAFNYWRLCDHNVEQAYFGLLSENGARKPAYYVWKYIDTQYTWDVTEQYLKHIAWSNLVDGTIVSVGAGFTPGFDWHDAMAIRSSKFDWNEHWDESKIIVREANDTPDF